MAAPTAPPAALGATRATARAHAIDVVRGAVMLLMALDHVRVYAGVPAGSPDPAVFLTRWVTNFCAPAFFLLAGTSAWLKGRGIGAPALARWLVTRGLVLVLLELTFLRFAWTFNVDYAHYTLAGVIWSLGWSMALLAPIVRLPAPAALAIGLLQILAHNAIRPLVGGQLPTILAGTWGPFLRILYFGGPFAIPAGGEPNFFVLYSLVPWWGVMCVGYAMGRLFEARAPSRARNLVIRGLAATAVFLVLRALQLYGDRPWRPGSGEVAWAAGWIMFLSTSKYPASLQFLLMTLGPTLVALGLLEGVRSRVTEWLAVYGRVPLFYYLLHIPLIHLVALGIAAMRTPASIGWLFGNHPMNPPEVPQGYMWSLPLLYGVTLLVVLTLYPLCRWYARAKSERRWGWTSYV